MIASSPDISPHVSWDASKSGFEPTSVKCAGVLGAIDNPLEFCASYRLVGLREKHRGRWARDGLFVLLMSPIALPAIAVTAALVALRLGRPILLRQRRVGLGGRSFDLYKFRTLPARTLAGADRDWFVEPTDRVAGFLRRTGLDELPQLANVLRGEMSLVGPRPERPYFVKKFEKELPDYHRRRQTPPGITGWAQIHGLRGDTSIARRLDYDLEYLRHRGPAMDVRILLKTAILLAKGLLGSEAGVHARDV